MTESGVRKITLEELQRHTSRESCWLAINGKVYDVTGFLHDHPGGDDVLLAVAGADATEAFEEVRHNIRAKMMLGSFKLGDLKFESTSQDGS